MTYVKGNSTDYVFLDSGGKEYPAYIEDYDRLSNEGFVEMFARWFKTEDKEFQEYMLKKLAEKLDVKLRKKPLTWEQVYDGMVKNIENDKEVQKLIKEIDNEV